MASGYWQVEVEPESREKTAFKTFLGSFQFNVLSFGLCNAPSAFQLLMEVTLADLTPQTCLVYIDDCWVFSETFGQHLHDLENVFLHFQSHNLELKPSKCTFAQSSVNFLGHVVSREGVLPDLSKTKAIN